MPFPSPGGLSDSGIEPGSPALQADSLSFEPPWKPLYMTTGKNQSFDYTDLCQQSDISAFNTLSRFVIAFLLRSKCLLISWLQSLSTVILEPKKIKSVMVSTFSLSICHEVKGPDAMIVSFLNVDF